MPSRKLRVRLLATFCIFTLYILKSQLSTLFIEKISNHSKKHDALNNSQKVENVFTSADGQLTAKPIIRLFQSKHVYDGKTSVLGKYHPKAPISELSKIANNIFLQPDFSFCKAQGSGQNVSLVLVLNRLSSILNRASIRSTFGNVSSFGEKLNFNWKTIFLTGKPSTKESETLLLEESRMFRDILAVNIPDEYNNIPILKQLICFRFLTQNCPSVNYLVKVDDDVYIRLPKLERAIEG